MCQIIMNDVKTMNYVQVTGRVVSVRYDEPRNELSFIVRARTPKTRALESSEDHWYRDTPAFHMTGDAAKEWKDKIHPDARISVIGHASTIRRMAYVGNRTYKDSYDLYLTADKVSLTTGHTDCNTVILMGTVSRVYRNADPGKRFYIPTVTVPMEDGSTSNVEFVYFDADMALEPQVGDVVHMTGAVRTKREEPEDPNGRSSVLVSITARTLSIERDPAA